MGNGLYFLNCENDNGVRRSGVAFYADIGDNNHNTNEQPKDFVYTDVSDWTWWESAGEQRATFPTGVAVNWTIQLDAQSKKQEEAVGTAYNGFQHFTVRKDNSSFLFRNNDGYNCNCVYYAFAN